MRSSLVSIGLMLTIGALAACSGSESPSVDGDPSSEDELGTGSTTLKDSNNGKTITVEKGKDITVSLSSNASTGYKWSVVSTDRSFGYPTPMEGTYEGARENARDGRGGSQTFVWKTDSPFLEPGSAVHAVTLEYRRPFESDATPAAKTFKFKVKIKQGAEVPAPVEPARECPTVSSVNCMPPVRSGVANLCNGDYRSWAQANCDVRYLD